jgi:hypothetical protein
LDKRAAAVTALVPLRLSQDADRTASNGTVADGYWFWAVAVQVAHNAALPADIRENGVLGFNFVFIAVQASSQGFPAWEVKDVGHSLHPIYPAGKFVVISRAVVVLEPKFKFMHSWLNTLRPAHAGGGVAHRLNSISPKHRRNAHTNQVPKDRHFMRRQHGFVTWYPMKNHNHCDLFSTR